MINDTRMPRAINHPEMARQWCSQQGAGEKCGLASAATTQMLGTHAAGS